MHEVGLAEQILQMVEQAARREGFSRVASLRVEAGALSGVDAQALQFAFEAIAPSTCLDGASFEIDVPRGHARCPRCGADTTTDDLLALCPACGHCPLTVTGGDQLRIVELKVE